MFSQLRVHGATPQRAGPGILSCKPKQSEGLLLTLSNMSARFFYLFYFFMSIMQRKWFALCVNHTFSRGMRGCRQLGVTRAPPSLIRPGIPAISHRHLQARRIQPLFSSLWPQCYRSSAWPNVAEILKEKGDPCPCLY